MDLASMSAQPTPILVGKVTLLIHPGTPRQVGRLQAWLNNQPSPKRPVTSFADLPKGAPVAVVNSVLKAEQDLAKDWPPEVASPEGNQVFMTSEEGATLFLRVALEKGHPEVNEAMVKEMLDLLTYPVLQAIWMLFFQWMDAADLPKALRPKGAEAEPEADSPSE